MSSRKAARLTIADVEGQLRRIAPPELAQPGDNVGLLAGDPAWPCRAVLLCIDLTEDVLIEARRAGSGLIVAYHPPIFKPVSRITTEADGPEVTVCAALADRTGIYAMHTALDAAEGGTNDVMAGLCGLADCQPFGPAGSGGYKVVVFVPPEHVEAVAERMFQAGAGVIGDYTRCSFRGRGEGTFWGGESARPAVGLRGRLERIEEVRLETIVDRDRLTEVIGAIRASHPYQVPAIDVYRLEPVAGASGIGRMGRLERPMSLLRLGRKLRSATQARGVRLIGRADRRVRRVAVCVGAAGRLLLESPDVRRCEAVVTGELRHHEAVRLKQAGLAAIVLGHWASERPVLESVARRLRGALVGLKVAVSAADRCPFDAI